jgi:hypothetical protein
VPKLHEENRPLPHDGVATNNISGKRYIDHWIEAGFECATFVEPATRKYAACRTRRQAETLLVITMSERMRTQTSVSGRSMIGAARVPHQ